jgi:hypothetical protein
MLQKKLSDYFATQTIKHDKNQKIVLSKIEKISSKSKFIRYLNIENYLRI